MAEEVKSMEWVDPADGQKYLIVKLGGAKNSNGEDAGSVVADNAFMPAASTGNNVTSTLSAVAAFAVEHISKLGMQLEVTTATLDQLDLYVKYHADGDYIDLGVGTDWSTGSYPIINSDIANDASIAVGSHYIDIDVSAFYSIQIWMASSATSTVDVYAGGIRNG